MGASWLFSRVHTGVGCWDLDILGRSKTYQEHNSNTKRREVDATDRQDANDAAALQETTGFRGISTGSYTPRQSGATEEDLRYDSD